MQRRLNHRGFKEKYKTGEHLTLVDLRRAVHDAGIHNDYLFKENVPAYPRPEFHVVRLKHDTGPIGLSGIIEDNGFKNPRDSPMLWWALAVGPDEMASAERRLLETTYPDRTEEQIQNQESFLQQFASSPAFEISSRFGSFRFTLPLQEVLGAYKKQFCGGAEPVMRVMETVVYSREVLYVVLVHSPANTEQFSDLPLLTDKPDSVCSYKDEGDGRGGHFLWRPEAMCETHSFELVLNNDEKQMQATSTGYDEWYNWDNVVLALHVEEQVLTFRREQLKESLRYCDKGDPLITNDKCFVDFEKAQQMVREKFDDPKYELKKV